MTSANYITTSTLADALGLPEDASDTDILDRLHELREAAGQEPTDDTGEATLIRRNEHDRVKWNADGTLTVTMLKPFAFGGETIRELTLREPEARDLMRQDGKKGTTSTVELIASTSGRTSKELAGLKLVDLRTLSRVLDFLSAGGR